MKLREDFTLDRDVAELERLATDADYRNELAAEHPDGYVEGYEEGLRDGIISQAAKRYNDAVATNIEDLLTLEAFDIAVEYVRSRERLDIGGFDWNNPTIESAKRAEGRYNEVNN